MLIDERPAGPGFAIIQDRDERGRKVWRGRAWSGKEGPGEVVEIEQRGKRSEVRRLAELERDRLAQRRGAA